VIFLIGYAALILVARNTLSRVMVNGDLYHDVVRDKDLIADILPPPLYLLETYLLTLQAAQEVDVGGRTSLIRQVRATVDDYRTRHAYWVEHLTDPELKDILLVKSHEPAEAFLAKLENDFLPLAEREVTPAALREAVAALERDFGRHRVHLQQAVPRARQEIAEHEQAAADAVKRGTYATLAVAAAFILVVGVVGFLVVRSILKSVGLMIERMREMALADADLSRRLQIRSGDEAGELAKWFNAFLDKIADLVVAVKRSSIQLTSTATQMSATSHEQEATVSDFGASTNQIAAAVKEISATAADLMSTMQEVRSLAGESTVLATEGRTGLDGMESTMKRLAESSASISGKLSVINEKAGDITSVVTTITRVADQTNLLSVNAAIEAEKSGEYGRGFLVVAREIRRLADQTAGATLDIEQTVGQMQSAVSAGVMEMDKFTDQVRRTVEMVDGISQKLGGILEHVETLTERFGVVTEGMTSQVEGAHQIDKAMGSLAEGVRRTVGSLGEFTSAADDMRGAVEALKHEVAKFRLQE
jgi:methyl-accepting chemotaxis protein WspA